MRSVICFGMIIVGWDRNPLTQWTEESVELLFIDGIDGQCVDITIKSLGIVNKSGYHSDLRSFQVITENVAVKITSLIFSIRIRTPGSEKIGLQIGVSVLRPTVRNIKIPCDTMHASLITYLSFGPFKEHRVAFADGPTNRLLY